MVNSSLKCVICSKYAITSLFVLFSFIGIPSFAQHKQAKVAVADTFKLADQLIAKKKFRKAGNLYTAYLKHNPKDLNAMWKLAQVKFWLGNFKKSDDYYKASLKIAPGNDYLRLNYIHSLSDMDKTDQADKMLTDMELAGKDYSDMSLLRAKLKFYKGDYKEAEAYMRKSLNAEKNNAEAHDLDGQIEVAKAPLLAFNLGYATDDQPLTAVISTIRFENYFNKYADLYLICDEYHFMQDKVSDAPWVRVGDKMFFPKAGLHVNIGAGIMQFPVKNETSWSANLSLNQKLSPQFDLSLSGEHVPYLDTKTSVDSNISVTKVSAMLNWHLRNWSAQAAVLNSTYPYGNTSNNVSGAYGWVLVPVIQFPHGRLSVGYSISYSSSNYNTFTAEYAAPNISGIYNPYFTPNQLFINSGLLALNLNPSKKVSINFSGDVGYGTIDAPYLFLNKDNAIERGFATQTFTPVNATAAFNFQLGNYWVLNARYIYHNTYFYTSHYACLGLQKSFVHRKKKGDDRSASTFQRLINEIEGKIAALYKCKDIDDLRKSIAEVRSQMVTLRDAQKNKRNNSEIVQNSDEANQLQDRYDTINDMIIELDAVDLDDYNQEVKSKKEWMVDKLFELTSITYNGNRD